ncbi:two-component response regulator ARR2-like [Papaver somniferum]|uniref:two-component response regulator ARR2-like n=1 Tax=Papaver somniferum TaxID=3469 RepID=UPI000E6FDF3A|nr:two-component response regulator ARR2-like [Papaver somniferum]
MSRGLEESSQETQPEVNRKETEQHEVVKKEHPTNEGLPEKFPEGVRVLVIDDDPEFLQHIEKLLKELLYQVTTYSQLQAETLLSTLQAARNKFDIVLSSLYMANMDGLELLKHMLAEMEIPVVMMVSSKDDNNIVIKCLTEGACDCLIKPIERKDIELIFKHVIIRKMRVEHSCECECHQKSTETSDFGVALGNSKSLRRKRKNGEEIDKVVDTGGMSMAKKTRIVWTDELNRKFDAVIEKLGIEKAVPKKILELMNVPGLKRDNVASHLQKYRQSYKNSQGYPACNLNTSMNQPESHLAPLLHSGGLIQYSNKFQNHSMQDGQLGRPTHNTIDPLLSNGRFRPDHSKFVTKTGYIPHQSQMRDHYQSQMRDHYINSLPGLMEQKMFLNGQDHNARAAHNRRNQPYSGGDLKTNYMTAEFLPNYHSIDSTLNLPNFPTNNMIHHEQSFQGSIDENCMKWKQQPPCASSDLDASNSIYPPPVTDRYSLLNSQKNNHGHSDNLMRSQNNHHFETLAGAQLLKPPQMEGMEPQTETKFEDDEMKFEDDDTKSED